MRSYQTFYFTFFPVHLHKNNNAYFRNACFQSTEFHLFKNFSNLFATASYFKLCLARNYMHNIHKQKCES